MVKASELKGRAIVSLERVQKIGALQGLVLDPNAARVAGLQVGAGEGQEGGAQVIPAEAVYKIGPDAITVRDAGAAPAANRAAWDQLPTSSDLGQTKVVTDGGSLLGQISDILIDETSLAIQGYDLGGGSFLDQLSGKGKFLPAQAGYRYGNGLLLVPDAMAGVLQQGVQPPAPAGQPGAPVAQPGYAAPTQPGGPVPFGPSGPPAAPVPPVPAGQPVAPVQGAPLQGQPPTGYVPPAAPGPAVAPNAPTTPVRVQPNVAPPGPPVPGPGPDAPPPGSDRPLTAFRPQDH